MEIGSSPWSDRLLTLGGPDSGCSLNADRSVIVRQPPSGVSTSRIRSIRLIDQAVSHGCVRLHTESMIESLQNHVPLGTSVKIIR
jgi:hypothetical protein